MRNIFNPVDRATLALDCSYLFLGMYPLSSYPSGNDDKKDSRVVYSRKLMLVSTFERVEDCQEYQQRIARIKSLAEKTAGRVGLEVTVADPWWDVYDGGLMEVVLSRPAKLERTV